MTIVRYYLDLQNKYTKIYGHRTILLMAVGSFHESYSIAPKEGYNLHELSNLLNLTCTKKNKSIPEVSIHNPYLLGFPTVALAKYLKILVDNGYTVVIFDQFSNTNDVIERKLTGIYSGGTYISDTPSSDMNYLISIYMVEEASHRGLKPTLNCGMTWVDVSTGTSIIHECHGSHADQYYGLDEVLRIIKSYNPKEIIIYYHELSLSDGRPILTRDDICKYLEIDNFHFYVHKDVDNWNGNAKSRKDNFLPSDAFKVNYQNQILSNVFGLQQQLTLNKNTSPIEVLDLETKPYGTISLMIILEFIRNHNENLLRNLSKPNIYIHQKYLILGNNAVQQLNVLNANHLDSYQKQFQSLFDVVDRTCTAMGRRFLKENLLNPLSQENKSRIQLRYDAIDTIIKNVYSPKISEYLNQISDLERLHRKMSISYLHPTEFCSLDASYYYVLKVISLIYSDPDLKAAMNPQIRKSDVKEFMMEYQKRYQLDIANKFHLSDISDSFYLEGIYPKIDKLQNDINSSWKMIEQISDYFSTLLDTSNGKSMVAIIHNETNGYFLSITKTRAELLKKKLSKIKSIDLQQGCIPVDEIIFKNLPKGNTRIFIKTITKHSDDVIEKRERMARLIRKYYLEDLNMFYTKYSSMFSKVAELISELDFLNSGAIVASVYAYCKPTMPMGAIKGDRRNPSYIKCEKLRHSIVERINKEFEYIPNDVTLGNIDNKNGMLLFSINGCGKSVFMKSIGLALILAQIGYYVPAQSFEYEPYMALFARITGNDNILKGLSSFTLEMTELQAIIKRTTDNGINTMVIGDEISKGTETISGTAIVASTLMMLSKCNCTFIFSTHLHQIPKLDEIKALSNLKSYHMRVEYDSNSDCLVFDRKLCPGSGPEIYGLMVAKYLIKNSDFINQAEAIKRKLMGEHEELIPINPKKSRFNSIIFMTRCCICLTRPINDTDKELETHHIHFQKDCLNGQIISKPYLHKNHMSNLIVVCRKCHEDIHRGTIVIEGHVETSKGTLVNYDYVEKKKLKKQLAIEPGYDAVDKN
jgi:DNA mismatch repair protein MutS